jgi:hypothetical protein
MGKIFHHRLMGPAWRWTHFSRNRRIDCGGHGLSADDTRRRRSGRISSSASSQGQDCPDRAFMGLVSGHSYCQTTPGLVLCLCSHRPNSWQTNLRKAVRAHRNSPESVSAGCEQYSGVRATQ